MTVELAKQRNSQGPSPAVRLEQIMAAAGWEIGYIDLDLAAARPKVEIRVIRCDGRWLLARVDSIGRCTVERFHRERHLGLTPGVKGCRPLSPQVSDVFLGRQSYPGPRAMLRQLTAYLVENAVEAVSLAEMRSAWATLMAAPTRIAAGAGGAP